MIFFGCIAALFFVLNLIGAINSHSKLQFDQSDRMSRDMAIWFIAMVICFK